ncbi:MAG: hypothetical protein H6618_03090 [Deltaproteobacteria bacterium]|nr:hypothetical protein [Deltaproteobacteria bacterium]
MKIHYLFFSLRKYFIMSTVAFSFALHSPETHAFIEHFSCREYYHHNNKIITRQSQLLRRDLLFAASGMVGAACSVAATTLSDLNYITTPLCTAAILIEGSHCIHGLKTVRDSACTSLEDRRMLQLLNQAENVLKGSGNHQKLHLFWKEFSCNTEPACETPFISLEQLASELLLLDQQQKLCELYPQPDGSILFLFHSRSTIHKTITDKIQQSAAALPLNQPCSS